MNGDELERFVPELLEARYPGRAKEVGKLGIPDLPSGGAWMLELDGCIMTVRASKVSNPFIWLRGGLAHAIPRSEALTQRVAMGNKDLVVGRLYLALGDEIAMAAFDETVFGGYLSFDYSPSIEDMVNKLETSIQYTNEWAETIRKEFGGQSFTADDWHLLIL